jgi:hypothetical protein
LAADGHAHTAGDDVTSDRRVRTPEATERDAEVVARRAARHAPVAELDGGRGFLSLLSRVRDEFRPPGRRRHAPDVTMKLVSLRLSADVIDQEN